MSGPGVGFEYPSEEVTWLKRDALLFANSIGCKADELHFLYELHPDFAVFPTYVTILPFKLTNPDVIDFYASRSKTPIPGVPNFDSQRVVDGERKIEFLKQLPTSSEGKKFEIRSKVLGVYDKGKASVLETETTIVDKDTEEVYSRAIGSAFFVGQGGWGGPKGPSAVNYPPPQGKKPDAISIDQTGQETAHLYRLNGDYNPLHATPEPGQKMGFGGTIIHGLYSWNATAHAVLRELGGSDPKHLREFQARFASPVRPGDRLTTEMWKIGEADNDGFQEVRFITKNQDGKVVLSNGRAVVKVVSKSGSKL
ncbi:putative peroxisomal dehydratase [Talaromyces proteolyticus]|uniref:Peroxisomal dehydratase n=1 Tax=Talaromyces proteolyticus TaxID=1131652 RepID=A0AAD4KT63_9EURO|nr:putative peroxisomal dehydratase [Talaromyces proteolyticus]KAH8695390.1 putative peroxisomal dehydratase [Talaromyces proteolyticus]